MSNLPSDEVIKSEVEEGMALSRKFVEKIDFSDVKSGEWFFQLLRQVMATNKKNARAAYFQDKYPGQSPDELAKTLVSVSSRYAAVAGGIAGAAVTANQIATLSSLGMTAALWLGTLGVEMVYLSTLQMRLVIDIATIYDIPLDADDPEDILMVFGYAVGVTPSEFLGKGAQIAVGTSTKAAIKTYISKGTLKAIQKFARRLGIKLLQRTIIKFAVPLASMAVGSTYNYATTRSIGRIAQTHFRKRDQASEELRFLVSREATYDVVFPACIIFLAKIDGEFSREEQGLYKSIMKRMSWDGATQNIFNRLIESEASILVAIRDLNDEAASQTLLDLLILMAVFDGKVTEEERQFLQLIANEVGLEIDMEDIEKQAKTYQVEMKDGVIKSVMSATSSSLDTVKGRFGRLMKGLRKSDQDEFPNVD